MCTAAAALVLLRVRAVFLVDVAPAPAGLRPIPVPCPDRACVRYRVKRDVTVPRHHRHARARAVPRVRPSGPVSQRSKPLPLSYTMHTYPIHVLAWSWLGGSAHARRNVWGRSIVIAIVIVVSLSERLCPRRSLVRHRFFLHACRSRRRVPGTHVQQRTRVLSRRFERCPVHHRRSAGAAGRPLLLPSGLHQACRSSPRRAAALLPPRTAHPSRLHAARLAVPQRLRIRRQLCNTYMCTWRLPKVLQLPLLLPPPACLNRRRMPSPASSPTCRTLHRPWFRGGGRSGTINRSGSGCKRSAPLPSPLQTCWRSLGTERPRRLCRRLDRLPRCACAARHSPASSTPSPPPPTAPVQPSRLSLRSCRCPRLLAAPQPPVVTQTAPMAQGSLS